MSPCGQELESEGHLAPDRAGYAHPSQGTRYCVIVLPRTRPADSRDAGYCPFPVVHVAAPCVTSMVRPRRAASHARQALGPPPQASRPEAQRAAEFCRRKTWGSAGQDGLRSRQVQSGMQILSPGFRYCTERCTPLPDTLERSSCLVTSSSGQGAHVGCSDYRKSADLRCGLGSIGRRPRVTRNYPWPPLSLQATLDPRDS